MSVASRETLIEYLRAWNNWRETHHGIAPTRRELAVVWGLSSTSAVQYRLEGLMSEGWMGELGRYASRAQYLTPEGEEVLKGQAE